MAEPWGWTIDMGMKGHVTRHVFGATGDGLDETTVRKVADAVTGHGVWPPAGWTTTGGSTPSPVV
jgi:hypothetical protein